MIALDVQLKVEHAHGIYLNSLCYISYHILVVQGMTFLNSKICLAHGGQIVKPKFVLKNCQFCAPVESGTCILCVCAHAHQL